MTYWWHHWRTWLAARTKAGPAISDETSAEAAEQESSLAQAAAVVCEPTAQQPANQSTLASAMQRLQRGLGNRGVQKLAAAEGEPVPATVRNQLSGRLGDDLADVRLHTGTGGDAIARSARAEAVAMGREIAFARGAYQPETPAGRARLAHELAHTVQAGEGAGRDPGSLEAEAQRGTKPSRGSAAPGQVLRQDEAEAETLERWQRKLLDFLAQIKAGEEIRLTRRNAKRAAEVLTQSDMGTPGFELTAAERERLLFLQLQGKVDASSTPEVTPDAETALDEPEPAAPAEEPAEEPIGESSNMCADFSYEHAWCNPPHALRFEDFSAVADGSLDPIGAQVEAGMEAMAQEGRRFYQAIFHSGVMEEAQKKDQNVALLQHEQLHWAIWCRLAQLGNDAIARGVPHAQIDSFLLQLGHDLIAHYDQETGHRLQIGGQMNWNDRWCIYVDDAFKAKLGNP